MKQLRLNWVDLWTLPSAPADPAGPASPRAEPIRFFIKQFMKSSQLRLINLDRSPVIASNASHLSFSFGLKFTRNYTSVGATNALCAGTSHFPSLWISFVAATSFRWEIRPFEVHTVNMRQPGTRRKWKIRLSSFTTEIMLQTKRILPLEVRHKINVSQH